MTKGIWGPRAAAAIAFVCLLAAPAFAQYTTVSGLHAGPSGSPAANATIYWQPVTAARIGTTSGQLLGVPVSAQVTAGAFTMPANSIADTSLSNPANTCYAVTVIDNITGSTILGAGLTADGHVNTGGAYGCVQPSGSTWNFDTFIPNSAPTALVVAGPTGPTGAAGAGFISGLSSDGASGIAVTGAMTGAVADKGGEVFNVKAYGAKGDGSTNDCTAIGAAITAHDVVGNGELFFPQGTYNVGSSCHLTLAHQTTVTGVGKCSYYDDSCGSVIVSSDATGVLFTITANVGKFQNIGLWNTAATPTAGAAIFTNGALAGQMVDYDAIWVSGFYDNVHVGVGAEWSMRASYLKNFVRYGLYVQNTVNSDAGDWVVMGCYIEGGAKTGANSAAINYESGGGGKMIGNKLLGATKTTWGIRMNVSGSGQTLITSSSIEQSTAEAIKIVAGWPGITISDNYLWAANGFSCVSGSTGQQFYFGGGTCFEGGVGVTVPALNLAGGLGYTIAPFAWSGFTDTTTITGGQVGLDSSRGNLNIWGSNTPQLIGNGQAGEGFWFSKATATDYIQGLNSKYNGTNNIATSTSGLQVEWSAANGWVYYFNSSLTPFAAYTRTQIGQINIGGNTTFGSYAANGTATFQFDNSPPASTDANNRINRPSSSQNACNFWATGNTSNWSWCTLSGGTAMTLVDRSTSRNVATFAQGAPASSFAMDASGNISVAGGANIVYRCATAGTLPIGALTITTGNCGTTTDTGLRVK